MPNPSLVILNEVKDLNFPLRINSLKDRIFTLVTSFLKWSRFFAYAQNDTLMIYTRLSRDFAATEGRYHFNRLIWSTFVAIFPRNTTIMMAKPTAASPAAIAITKRATTWPPNDCK